VYDVLILKGANRPHRNQWLSALSANRGHLKILAGNDQNQVIDAHRIHELGYEDYFNKVGADQFREAYIPHVSFLDGNPMFIRDLPHRRMFQDCAVNVILETTCCETDFPFLTEKTWKAIINARPFILFGDTGSLRKLRQEGFLTFADFCDESYDNEIDVDSRISKSVTALHQLADACGTHANKIDAICDHNQRHFFNIHRLENKLAKFGKLCMETLYS
jgi:hypothetical protein